MTARARVDDANVSRAAVALATPDARADRFDVELTTSRRDDRCDVQLLHAPAVDTDSVQLEVFDQFRQLHAVHIYSNLEHRGR